MSAVNLQNFPEDLHRAAKIRAATEGVTMKEIVIRALTEYLQKKPDKPKKGGQHGN